MIRAIHLVLAVGLAQAVQGQVLQGTLEPTCSAISGERILGRDLAAAVPALASLPPDLALGYSPMPGVRRVFLVSELQELAVRHDIHTRITAPVCFSWPVHPLSREIILEAVRKALAGQDAELEITDQCRMPVPPGEVIFPIEGLSAESDHPVPWNGYVNYATNRKFSTWVQVRVRVHEKRVVAARAIRPGELIGPADIKTIDYSGPLQRTVVLHEDHEANGQYARRPISQGALLTQSMLAPPEDVAKQQLVTVHTRCGAAHIETQGIAVDSGYRGDVIKVKNPKTGRVFLAQISDHGVVTVVAGGTVGLVVTDKKS